MSANTQVTTRGKQVIDTAGLHIRYLNDGERNIGYTEYLDRYSFELFTQHRSLMKLECHDTLFWIELFRRTFERTPNVR